MEAPKKVFDLNEKELTVTVTQSDDVFLPTEDRPKMGHYEQTTIQHIDKDKAQDLKEFLEGEKAKAEKQMDDLEKALEQVKDYKELDDKLVESVMKYQGKNKEFKKHVQALNDYIEKMNRKKQIVAQIEFMKPQIKAGNIDLGNLTKALA